METATKHYPAMSRDELLAEITDLNARIRAQDLTQAPAVHQDDVLVQQAQLVEVQHALEESRDRYADLFDFAPIAFLTVDRSGVIQDANLAAGALLDANRNRLPGFPLVAYVADRDRRSFLQHMSRCRTVDDTVETRLHLRGLGENERIVDVVGRRATRGARDVWHTCLVDVTASERADTERRAMELDQLRLRHEEKSSRSDAESKNRFLAVLSHELRTPLTPILLRLGALEARGAIPEELREPMALVRRNIEVEARLIDDLLDTTQIAHGTLHVERRCVDVHEVLENLLATATTELQAATLELRVGLAASERHVQGDALRLRQVFWHLLGNAQRHTPAGGRITVTTRNPKPGCLVVRVEDTGTGIEPGLIGRIFEPFEQAQGATRSGLGLGLAISRGIVDAHHGRIRAVGDGQPRGATFEVELDTIAPLAEDVAQQSSVEPNAPGLRILVVEDHPDSAESLRELLSMYGHDVTLAATFSDASGHRGERYDLLITDIGLPDGNGLDLRSVLVQNDDTPTIALSGYGSPQDVQKSRAAGFDRHLTKPVSVDDLMHAIDDLTRPRAAAAHA